MTATERMPLVGAEDQIDTADEPWSDGEMLHYGAAAEFALKALGRGEWRAAVRKHRECLVIGSPLDELRQLDAAGWLTTHLDCRDIPVGQVVRVAINADATNIPYADDVFDAISTTCVLCHAGLGRYGDRIVPNGDELMMREMFRVLKPGGEVAMMAGPAFPWLRASRVYGNVHRIYQPCDVAAMAVRAGFDLLETVMWVQDGWMTEGTCGPKVRPQFDGSPSVEYCYLCMHLRKPA